MTLWLVLYAFVDNVMWGGMCLFSSVIEDLKLNHQTFDYIGIHLEQILNFPANQSKFLHQNHITHTCPKV